MEDKARGLTSTRYVQEKAYYGGALIIMSTGFYIAWSSYLAIFGNQWFFFITVGESLHAMISWHIGFMIGAVAAVFLIEKFTKNIIYYGSAGVVILSAILMLPSWSDIAPIIAARYIGGLAHGVAFLVTIIHASEVVSPNLRGRGLAALSCYLATSIFASYMIFGLFTYYRWRDFYADQVLSVLTIVYGIGSMITNRMFYIESPIYHLQNNDTGSALNTLAKLRNDSINSWSVTTEFGELQTLIEEQRRESNSLLEQTNLKPLLRATLLRVLYALCTIIAFNYYAYLFFSIDLRQFGLGLVHGARFVAEVVAMYLVDRTGRRLTLAASLAFAGLMLLLIGILLFMDVTYTLIISCGILFLLFCMAYGFGLAPISIIYMGESFSLKKKPYSILVILCIEQLVHVITFIIVRYAPIDSNALFLSISIPLIGAAALVYLVTPETKMLSMKECKDRLK